MPVTTMTPMYLTCERCSRTDHWLGPEGWITFPDGWNLIYERWRESSEAGPSQWVCDDCVQPADHEGASFVLPLGSDADAPRITMLSGEGSAHDCDTDYRTDCARCNGVSPIDAGCW